LIKERMITAIDDLCREYEPECPLNTPSGRRRLADVIQAAIMEPDYVMKDRGNEVSVVIEFLQTGNLTGIGRAEGFNVVSVDSAERIWKKMVGEMT
jgi:hypothetical protein